VCTGICTLLPLAWHSASAKGEWKARRTAGGPKGSPTFKYNPRYLVCPQKGTSSIWVGIEQEDNRRTSAAFNTISVYVLELDTFDENEEPETDDVVYTIMLHGRQMSEEVKVNADKWYLILPCAVRAGVEGTFWLRVTSSQPFGFKSSLREFTPSAAEEEAMKKCARIRKAPESCARTDGAVAWALSRHCSSICVSACASAQRVRYSVAAAPRDTARAPRLRAAMERWLVLHRWRNRRQSARTGS
jgi:hypothetical protein